MKCNASSPQIAEHPQATPRLLRVRDVMQRTGLSKSSWWKGVREGRFPKPVRITPRTCAWPEPEIDAIVQSAIEARG